MTHAIVSVGLFLFATALLLVPVAFVAGNVLRVWGTTSALEWSSEAIRRVFVGGLRRRFLGAVNRQCHIGVDKSRRTCPYIAVSVAPGDVPLLTGANGSLSGVATEAARVYARYARAHGWASDSATQLAVVTEEWLRRGTIKARPVSRDEFLVLQSEMNDRDEATATPQEDLAPPPYPATRSEHPAAPKATRRLPEDEPTASAGDALTAVIDSANAVTMAAHTAQIVFADAQGVRHEITSDAALIGRARGCRISLDNTEVSREHASVYFQEGSWWLRDRGSRNGTTVDGQQAKGTGPVRLMVGSQIVLGDGNAAPKLTITSLASQ